MYDRHEVGPVLPAMGYAPEQLEEMERAIRDARPDLVVIASPIDLSRLIDLPVPSVRVTYELREVEGSPTIEDALRPILS